jgi:hypothetical protein
VGFVVSKAALGQVSSEYFSLFCNRYTDSATLIIIHHAGLVQ